MRVLYIEDDKDDRLLFQDAVHYVDPNIVFEAANACEDGMFALKTRRAPDFIFLDINLPSTSGLECLRSIKSNPLLTSVPVIIYSGSIDSHDIEKCMKLGAARYLIKPHGFEELCSVLKLILQR